MSGLDEALVQLFDQFRAGFKMQEATPYFRMQNLAGAIMLASKTGHSLPKWAVDALSDGLARWATLHAANLDDAFGMEPMCKREFNERKNTQMSINVHSSVKEAQKSGLATDWAELAEKFNKSESSIQNHYYKLKPLLELIFPS